MYVYIYIYIYVCVCVCEVSVYTYKYVVFVSETARCVNCGAPKCFPFAATSAGLSRTLLTDCICVHNAYIYIYINMYTHIHTYTHRHTCIHT